MPNRQMVNGEPYRYAYQGQEKDPETGKEAFQLRLWDGRIGRWLTVDYAGSHFSTYLGMGNNPLFFIDPDGREIKPKTAADGPLLDALIVTLKTTHPQLYKYLHENTDIVIYVHFDNIPSTRPNTIFKGHSSVKFNDGRFPIDYKFVKLRNSEVIKGKKEIASFYSSGDSRKYEGTAPPIMGKHIINNPVGDNSDFDSAMEEFNNTFEINEVNIVLDIVNGNDSKTLAHELGHTEFAIDNSFEYYIYNYVLNNFNFWWGGHGPGNPDGVHAIHRETNDRHHTTPRTFE